MRSLGSKKWQVPRLATILWLGIALMAWSPVRLSAAPPKEVKIGVRVYSGVDAAQKKWSATAVYLSQVIEGYRFVMIPIVDFGDMETAVESCLLMACRSRWFLRLRRVGRISGRLVPGF